MNKKLRVQNQVFCHFLKFGSLVFTSRSKIREKKKRGQNWARSQNFRHFLKFASLVFLDITQDCSLGQSLWKENSFRNFAVCGSKDTVRQFLIFCLSPFLRTRRILPFSQSEGYVPVIKACLKVNSKGYYGVTTNFQHLNTDIVCPCALFELRF